MKVLSHVTINRTGATVDGRKVSEGNLGALYREFAGDYPKFFKMDSLCKLGFIGAELLLRGIDACSRENAAIVLFNRNGSLVTDRNYQRTIADGNYFPSPALFVYTLANIVTGEIAIRHKIYGETSFYVLDHNDVETIERIAADTYLTSSPSCIITGWLDYNDESDYLADLRLITK